MAWIRLKRINWPVQANFLFEVLVFGSECARVLDIAGFWIYLWFWVYQDSEYAKVITIKTLFASAKPSAVADYWGEFRGLTANRKDIAKCVYFIECFEFDQIQ